MVRRKQSAAGSRQRTAERHVRSLVRLQVVVASGFSRTSNRRMAPRLLNTETATLGRHSGVRHTPHLPDGDPASPLAMYERRFAGWPRGPLRTGRHTYPSGQAEAGRHIWLAITYIGGPAEADRIVARLKRTVRVSRGVDNEPGHR
jgi:hypothetical protein